MSMQMHCDEPWLEMYKGLKGEELDLEGGAELFVVCAIAVFFKTISGKNL